MIYAIETAKIQIKTPEIILPDNYSFTLNKLKETSNSLAINYAILGSLGIAASFNLNWCIRSEQELTQRKQRQRDIDVFIIGTDDQRRRFIEYYFKSQKAEKPRVDFVPTYLEKIKFEQNGEVSLTYKDIAVPVNKDLFRIYDNVMPKGEIIPVLHPLVYLAMIMLVNDNIIPPSIVDRLNFIKSNLSNFFDKDNLDKDELSAFSKFKRKVKKRYPYYYPVIDLRRMAETARENNDKLFFVEMIEKIKIKYPGLWKELRKLYQ